MQVLSIVHQRDAGSGVFADAAAERGDALVEWHPAEGDGGPPLESPAAVLVFGGAMHVDQEDSHPWLRAEKRLLREYLDGGVPLLGVCLGAQLLVEAAGAAAGRAPRPEIGWVPVELTGAARSDPVLGGLPERFDSFQWHSYGLSVPGSATELAHSPGFLQAFRIEPAAWGIQFHAEVTRDTVADWLARYLDNEDAVRAGVRPEAIRADTETRIEGWNELGRGLCRRFLDEAHRRAASDAQRRRATG